MKINKKKNEWRKKMETEVKRWKTLTLNNEETEMSK
jgi:hypothetical protein